MKKQGSGGQEPARPEPRGKMIRGANSVNSRDLPSRDVPRPRVARRSLGISRTAQKDVIQEHLKVSRDVQGMRAGSMRAWS